MASIETNAYLRPRMALQRQHDLDFDIVDMGSRAEKSMKPGN